MQRPSPLPKPILRTIWAGVALLCHATLPAQGFQLQYGGAFAQDAVATVSDAQGHSTLVRSSFPGDPRVRIQLLRTGLQGQGQQWHDVALGGACFVHAAMAAGDGNILLCGSRIAPGRSDQDGLIAKISQTGTVLWSWTSGTPGTQEELRDLKLAANGDIVACGTWRGAAASEALLVRTNANGNLQWQQHYASPGDCSALAVAVDANGIMAAGRIASFGSGTDAYILRTDPAGNAQWWQGWGGVRDEVLKGIAMSGPDFVMAGFTDSYGPGTGGQHVRSVYLIAMNAAGDTLWTRTFGDIAQASAAEDIRTASNGDLLVAGTAGNNHATDCLVMRISATGGQLWKRSYDLGLEDLLHRIAPLADGGFIAAGRSFSVTGMQAVLLRKNQAGN